MDTLVHLSKGNTSTFSILQQHRFNVNLILGVLSNAVVTIDKRNGRLEAVLGLADQRGYREGIGTDALFNYIDGLLQIHGSWIISDLFNSCLRRAAANALETTTYGGVCESAEGDIGFRAGSLLKARFHHPGSMVADPFHADRFFLIETFDGIVQVDMRYQNATMFYRHNFESYGHHIMIDPLNQDLLFDNDCTIQRLSEKGTLETLSVAIFPSWWDKEQFCTETKLRGFSFITSNTVLAADSTSNRLLSFTTLNKQENPYKQICKTLSFYHGVRLDGPKERCRLTTPMSVLVLPDYVYIGEREGVRRLTYTIKNDSRPVADNSSDITTVQPNTTTELTTFHHLSSTTANISTKPTFPITREDAENVTLGGENTTYLLPMVNSQISILYEYQGETR